MASTTAALRPTIEFSLPVPIMSSDKSRPNATHMSLLDNLCLSVGSISLKDSSVEDLRGQIVTKYEQTIHQQDTSKLKEEGELGQKTEQSTIDDVKTDVGTVGVVDVKEEKEKECVSCTEENGEAQLAVQCLKTPKTENGKCSEDVIDDKDVVGSSQQHHHSSPKEHDETRDILIARSPPGGVAVQSGYDTAVIQFDAFSQQLKLNLQDSLAADYASTAKYRKPSFPPDYTTSFNYERSPGIAHSSLLNGGKVMVCSDNLQFGTGPIQDFHGSSAAVMTTCEPCTGPPMFTVPGCAISANNEVNDVVDDFFGVEANQSLVDFESFVYSKVDSELHENLTSPAIQPTEAYTVSSGFPAVVSPVHVLSPQYEYSDDGISISSVLSPENQLDAMSPISAADSGLETTDELDNILAFIDEEMTKENSYSKTNPHFGNPGHSVKIPGCHFGNSCFANQDSRNSSGTISTVAQQSMASASVLQSTLGISQAETLSFYPSTDMGIPNPSVSVLPTVVRVSLVVTTDGPVIPVSVPGISVPSVPTQPVQPAATAALKPAPRVILPRPPDFPKSGFSCGNSSNAGKGELFIPEPDLVPESTIVDNDHKVRVYRQVSSLTTQQILQQDEDGDTCFHMAVLRHNHTLVDALLRRLERDGKLLEALNTRNKDYQTPLCMAVMTNSPALVKSLIRVGSDVNIELLKTQQLNTGVLCYRLIHYVADKGVKFSGTIDEILAAPNTQLDAHNSEGFSALHIAIEGHGRLVRDTHIDSRRTIYQLLDNGADITVKHLLNGKTPLHFAVEKKSAEFLSWFLSVMHYFAEKQVTSSAAENPRQAAIGLVREMVNARMSNGATALHLAAALKMNASSVQQRSHMIALLLSNGAEFSSRTDSKLRSELAKDPMLTELVKNAQSNNHRT